MQHSKLLLKLNSHPSEKLTHSVTGTLQQRRDKHNNQLQSPWLLVFFAEKIPKIALSAKWYNRFFNSTGKTATLSLNHSNYQIDFSPWNLKFANSKFDHLRYHLITFVVEKYSKFATTEWGLDQINSILSSSPTTAQSINGKSISSSLFFCNYSFKIFLHLSILLFYSLK